MKWQTRILVVVSVALLCTLVPVLALSAGVRAEDNTEGEVDSRVFDNISQNCSSIKQSLRDLQRADSRTRAYLGSAYETVSRDFITPLNLRLVRNNRVATKLFEIQGDFSSKQGDFRTKYTAYMRELESLIASDCQGHPKDFYRQLQKTREHRTKLHNLAEDLNKLVSEQYQGVKKLREEI